MKRVRNAAAAAEAIRKGEVWPSMAADLRRMVPRWHFDMLADAARNTALLDSIAAVVEPGQLVLDVGTGAGLTALAAAKAGGTVVTCETNPVVAELARRVVAANGYASSVNVVNRRSTVLIVGRDLPRQADVLVAEVFDADLFSEGAVPTIDDARRRLLRPDAAMLPRRGEVWCQLVESHDLAGLNRVGVVDGFDLTPFNLAATEGVLFAPVACHNWAPLAGPVRLFELDFTAPADPGQVSVAVPVDTAGTVHAAVVWFSLNLDGGGVLANTPGVRSHWKQAVWVVDVGEVKPGQQVTVNSWHDTSRLWLTADGAAG